MSKDILLCKEIFKKHSKTYYYSTLLFPKTLRHKVYVLYAFVRVADEFVDNPKSNPEEALKTFRMHFDTCWDTGLSTDPVIQAFVKLAKEANFEKKWIDAFFHSMEMDLWKMRYATFQETEEYIYGSAEVIGLMMSKLMGVSEEGLPYAEALGKAMQLINFLRDIKEDGERGRIYFPLEELKTYHVTEEEWIQGSFSTPENIRALLEMNIERIITVQKMANQGFSYIPWFFRMPVRLAAYTYYDTLLQIQKDPLIVFQRKVTSTRRMMIKHLFHLLFSHSA